MLSDALDMSGTPKLAELQADLLKKNDGYRVNHSAKVKDSVKLAINRDMKKASSIIGYVSVTPIGRQDSAACAPASSCVCLCKVLLLKLPKQVHNIERMTWTTLSRVAIVPICNMLNQVATDNFRVCMQCG